MSIVEKDDADLTEDELDEIVEIIRDTIAKSKYANKIE